MRLFLFLAAISLLPAQTLSIYSGNGQIVQEQFLSTVPITAQAKDSAGKPAANVKVTWTITQGTGTIEGAPTTTTDANGLTGITFLASGVPPGTSFSPITITASSGTSNVNFFLTTVLSRLPAGGFAAPPQGQLIVPTPGGSITGHAGSTLPAAVQVLVTALSGAEAGQPVPNVGVRIAPNSDPAQPSAACNAPAGIVLTDSHGIATCDLVLGQQTGTTQLAVVVGEAQTSPTFTLQVTSGAACTYAISPSSQSIAASGGSGSLLVATGASCTWTAISNASWVLPAQSSGTGSGTLNYLVAADNGASRTGTLTIAGQSLTITQSGTGGNQPLMITTPPALPTGVVGTAYSTMLSASGASGSYQWTALATLPRGLTLSSTGVLSGVPTAAGAGSFNAAVTDSVTGASQTQNFTVTIVENNGTLAITNQAFPGGVIGQAYKQLLTSSPGCSTPFSPGPAFRLANGSALPPGLSIQQNPDNSFAIVGTPTTAGSYPFTLTVSDACGSLSSAAFSITISATQGVLLTAAPATLQFVAVSGGGAPQPQTLTLTSASSVAFSANGAAAGGGNWLTIGNPSGATPGAITVNAVNTAQLAPGTYNASITITSPAANSPVVVPVTLTVIAQSSMLVLTPSSLSATLPNSGATTQQYSLTVGSGGGQLPFTAAASTTDGSPWLLVNPNSGTTPAAIAVIINAANLKPGLYSGAIAVTSAAGQQAVQVLLNVSAGTALMVSPTELSFTGAPGSPATSQIVNITGYPGAFAIIPVTATASTTSGGNWLTVSPASGLTPSTITASADSTGLAAGSYIGLISLQTTNPLIPAVNIPVTLRVTAAAAPAIAAITNGASFIAGPIAPGELLTIFGAQLGPVMGSAFSVDGSGGLSTALAGTRVLFDGVPAPLLYTSAGQASAIVPYFLAGRVSTAVQVEFNGMRSAALNFRLADSAPAIFTTDPSGQGAILNQDDSVNSAQNEAAGGSVISIYATGAGQTNPAGVDGQITGSSSLPVPLLPVTIQIGGQSAQVTYAGAAPGLPAGVLQVNAVVPNGVHGAQVPVMLTVGSQSSPAVFMGVQ